MFAQICIHQTSAPRRLTNSLHDKSVSSLLRLYSTLKNSGKSSVVVWYKQWKVRSGCLEKVALGNSRGSSDFPEGRSPDGMSDYPREFPRATFSRQPLWTFHCLSEFWIKTVKNMRARVALGLTLNIFT